MRHSNPEQPEAEAPGSKSKPGWRPNLRQQVRLSQSGWLRSCQFQLSLSTPRSAVALFSQNWAMSRAFTHLLIATPQGQTQLVLQFLEIGNLLFDIRQFFFQTPAHGSTRL